MRARLTDKLIEKLPASQARYDVWDTDAVGLHLRVMPSGVKVFRQLYRHDGQRRFIKLGNFGAMSTEAARAAAKVYAGEAAKGIDVQEDRRQRRAAAEREAKRQTLAEFINGPYAEWCHDKKSGAATLTRLRAMFLGEGESGGKKGRKAAGVRNLGAAMVDELDELSIDRWRIGRVKAGIAAATIRRDLVALQSVLSRAVAYGLRAENPLAGRGKLPKVPDGGKPRYLTESEEFSLREALAKRDAEMRSERHSANAWRATRSYDQLPALGLDAFGDHLTPIVLLAMNTGMRRGELFALRWECVDLVGRVVTALAETTKGNRIKHVPLNNEATQTLARWRHQCDASAALVFPSHTGEQLTNVQTSWENLLEQAGIQGFRFHDLRHHFCSRLVMAGADLNTVRELAGHSDIKMTLRYAHLSPGHKAAAVQLLDTVPNNANAPRAAAGTDRPSRKAGA